MMMQVVHPPEQAALLFAGWEETLLWSCLQGVMGKVYAPASPPGCPGRFGGLYLPGRRTSGGSGGLRPAGMPPGLPPPAPPERGVGPGASRRSRTSAPAHHPLRHEKGPRRLPPGHLNHLAGRLLPGDALRPIQGELYHRCLADPWSRDLVAQFSTEGDYARLGLGVAVVRQGELVAGASSYARYRTGIEIEVDTRPDCRRQGLATAASACPAALPGPGPLPQLGCPHPHLPGPGGEAGVWV